MLNVKNHINMNFDFTILSQITHIPVANYTINLGDDIQSEAACRLFGVRDYVNRDDQKNWPKESLVPLIGWYSHGYFFKKNNVIIIGFNLQNKTMNKIKQDAKIVDWLKSQVKNQKFPALCRDLYTRDFLRSLKIEAEFCGCITSSLKTKNFNRTRKIAFDVVDRDNGFEFMSNIDNQLPLMSSEQRLIEASNRIDLFDQCLYVQTSRLHVYLPCKALGVKVDLRLNEVNYQPQRFFGHLEEQEIFNWNFKPNSEVN